MGVVMRGLLGAAVIAGSIAAGPARWSAAGESEDLTGRLLVATPKMEDPTFARSVIFMVAHDDSGSLGVIVNEPVKDVTYGGPVEPRVGFVLHTKDFMLDQHELAAGDMAVTTDPDMLAAIAGGHGPAKYVVTLGYAGWGPGQLEMEMQQGDWLVVPEDPDLIFAPDPQKVWEQALAKYQTTL
jgi:putative transcriptional regulator